MSMTQVMSNWATVITRYLLWPEWSSLYDRFSPAYSASMASDEGCDISAGKGAVARETTFAGVHAREKARCRPR
jgi:hypothetical protein